MSSPSRPHALRALLIAGLLVFAGLVLFLRTEMAWDGACQLARDQLPRLTGLEVDIGRCEIDPLRQTVTLHRLEAREPGRSEALLAAEKVVVALRAIRPTYSVDLARVSLTKPKLRLDLRAPVPSKAGPAGCLLDAVPRARILQLDVVDAEVRALLPEGRELTLDDLDLSWREKRGVPQFQLALSRGALGLGANGKQVTGKLTASGALDLEERRLELERVDLEAAGGRATVKGKVASLCDPQLELVLDAQVPLSSVAQLGALGASAKGELSAKVELAGHWQSPQGKAELKGDGLQLDDFAPGDFRARARFDHAVVHLDELWAPAGQGSVRAKGRLRLSPKLPLELELVTDQAELAPVLAKAGLPGAWVNFATSAEGKVSGHLLPSPELKGQMTAKVTRFRLTGHAYDEGPPLGEDGAPERPFLEFDRAKVQSSVALHSDRFEFRRAQLELPATRATGDVTLFFDPAKGLQVDAQAQHIDLKDFGHIADIDWAGTGTGQVTIRGAYAGLRIDADANVRDFSMFDLAFGAVRGKVVYEDDKLSFLQLVGQKGQTAYSGFTELFFDKKVRAVAKFQVPAGRAQDVLDAISGLSPAFDIFQGQVGGEASGVIDLDSPGKLAGVVRFDLKNAAYLGRRLGDGTLGLRFVDGKSMVLEQAHLTGPSGKVSATGTFGFDGLLDFRFKVDDGSLAELIGDERAKAWGARANLTLVGRVEGDTTTPSISAYLTSDSVEFARRSLGEAHLEGRWVGKELQIWGRPFDDGRASLKVRLKEPYPFEASVSLALPEIRPLLPGRAAEQGLSGALQGTLTANGALADVRKTKARAHIEQLKLQRADFEGENEGPIVLSYADGRWGIEALHFRGQNTEFQALGTYGPETMDLKLRGALDMRLLESFMPAIERTAGRVDLTAELRGPLERPAMVGSAEVHDLRLSWVELPLSLRNLSGRIDFTETRVLVQDVFGVLNEGRVMARGDIRLNRFQLDRMALNLGLEEVSYRITDELPVTASGELLLEGNFDSLQLSGDLDVVKLRYEKSLALDAFLTQVKSVRVADADKPKEWLKFNVDVAASGDVRIDNNLAKARLGGKVRLIGTNVRPGIIGTIETLEGSQAFFRGNQFAVHKGELQFKDKSSIDPLVDLNAQTQVREYLVTLKTFGRLSDPKVLLSSDPPLPETDIISLLTLGVTAGDPGLSQAGTGLAAEALYAASGLDKQVQRFLPKGNLLKDLSFRLSTRYNEATLNVEPTAEFESKFLTDQLKLGMTQSILGRGTRAHAEYQFNDRVSARAQWDNENYSQGSYSFGNPGLDFKLRWELQ